jgi:hypothetical protein
VKNTEHNSRVLSLMKSLTVQALRLLPNKVFVVTAYFLATVMKILRVLDNQMNYG